MPCLANSPMEGLSPRLRGNRRYRLGCPKVHRSIPAPAGEPPLGVGPAGQHRVYPRACGGTGYLIGVHPRGCGLSPRLRGNRRWGPVTSARLRSIPAPAGEPPCGPIVPPFREVYPRACGGTTNSPLLWVTMEGLSPRLRGNPPAALAASFALGSIPAPAGEPHIHYVAHDHGGVYPRACGGTSSPSLAFVTESGLSPRLRGNPRLSCTG